MYTKSLHKVITSVPTCLPFYVPEFSRVLNKDPAEVSEDEMSACVGILSRWLTVVRDTNLNDILYSPSTINWDHFFSEMLRCARSAQQGDTACVKKFQKMIRWKFSLFETSVDILGTGAFSVVKSMPMLSAARKSFVYDKNCIREVYKKTLGYLDAECSIVDGDTLTVAIHSRIKKAQQDGLEGFCKILGFRKSYTPNLGRNDKKHTHIKYRNTPDQQKMYIYMESLLEFDDTLDDIIDDSNIGDFLLYCIYETILSQCALFEKTGIVHCDLKCDNIMLRKIEARNTITCSSLDKTKQRTFILSDEEASFQPVSIDFDCSVIWENSKFENRNVIIAKDDYRDYKIWKRGIKNNYHTRRTITYYFPFYSPIFSIEKFFLNALLFSESSFMCAAYNSRWFCKEFVLLVNRFLSFYGPYRVTTSMFRQSSYIQIWSVLEKTGYFSPGLRGIRATVDAVGMVSATEAGSPLRDEDYIIALDAFAFDGGLFTTYVKNGVKELPVKSTVTYLRKNKICSTVTQIKPSALLWTIRPTLPRDTEWRGKDWKNTVDYILYA